ncbi:MAG: hypothetical protein Q8P27_01245, partial [Candidatus Peregrinibacteria bacterium]|nr:hypothetical protein [Candidatus Peregrinibacteria bacterium]
EAHTWVTVEKKSGAAKHSALVSPSDPTLIEELANALEEAKKHFGEHSVSLVALQMGEDQNYNTWDGSGRVVMVIDAPTEKVTTWIGMSTLADGLSNEVTKTAPEGTDVKGTTIGLDIRELLDHKDAVQLMIGEVRGAMEGLGLEFEAVNNRPPWRCPEDNPHYLKFRAAYRATTGQNPATFVKPHGNDGGAVADEYQAANEEAEREGWAPVIVYGGIGEGPHGLNERHLAESSAARYQMLSNLAAEYAA